MFVLIVFPARKRVLIDTWWNVNLKLMGKPMVVR